MDELIPENEKTAGNESGGIIEIVQSRHDRRKKRNGKFRDILFIQFTMCIFMLLLIAAANIIRPGFAADVTECFKRMTSAETEEFFKKAAERVMDIINA